VVPLPRTPTRPSLAPLWRGRIERKPHGTRNRYCLRHDRLAELGSAFGGLLEGLAPVAANKETEQA